MRKLLRFIAFVLVLCVNIGIIAFVLPFADYKDVLHIKGFFYEPEDSVDVALIGASELYAGFNSPMAWDEFGFTSYSFCYGAMPGNHYKLALDEIMSRQNPRLIIVEFNGLLQQDGYFDDIPKHHTVLDNVPFDKIRRQYISEIVPKENQAEFRFNFIKYHDNWKRVATSFVNLKNKTEMFIHGISYTKAFSTNNTIDPELTPREFTPQLSKTSEECLVNLLEYCNELGIKNMLFMRFPHYLNNHNEACYDDVKNIVNKYGYDFVNFEKSFDETGIDPKHDFYNCDHLNVWGMEKFTPFFGKYITEHYDVITQHSEKDIEMWNKCAEKMKKLMVLSETVAPPVNRKFYFEPDGYKF